VVGSNEASIPPAESSRNVQRRDIHKISSFGQINKCRTPNLQRESRRSINSAPKTFKIDVTYFGRKLSRVILVSFNIRGKKHDSSN